MPTQDDIANQQRLLQRSRRRLAILEERAAAFGAVYIPAHLVMELEEARAELAPIEAALAALAVASNTSSVARRSSSTTAIGFVGLALLLFGLGLLAIAALPIQRLRYTLPTARRRKAKDAADDQ